MTTQNNIPAIKAVSNGVFAIALILFVIEINVLHIADQFSISDVWLSFRYLSPFFFAFLLSIVIVLSYWFSYQSILQMIDQSSSRFKYASGFLLVTIIAMPFAAAFLAEHGLTNLAGKAVALYSLVSLLQAIAWKLMMRSALYPKLLAKSNDATQTLRENYKKSSYIIFVFAFCTIIAFWFPLVIAIIIPLTWIAWLVSGSNSKERSLI